MAVLPVVEIALRSVFNTGIPASSTYVQNLTLWVGFLGAVLAARDGSHLTFLPGRNLLPPSARKLGTALTAMVSSTVAASLCWASLEFVRADMQSPVVIAGWLPAWVVEAILPATFAVITMRFVMKAETGLARLFALLNLAAADVRFLAEALVAHYKTGNAQLLDGYSAKCLARVWKAQRFSWWMTNLTHRFPEAIAFERRAQTAELAYLASSKAAQTALAENYVGLPLQ